MSLPSDIDMDDWTGVLAHEYIKEHIAKREEELLLEEIEVEAQRTAELEETRRIEAAREREQEILDYQNYLEALAENKDYGTW